MKNNNEKEKRDIALFKNLYYILIKSNKVYRAIEITIFVSFHNFIYFLRLYKLKEIKFSYFINAIKY